MTANHLDDDGCDRFVHESLICGSSSAGPDRRKERHGLERNCQQLLLTRWMAVGRERACCGVQSTALRGLDEIDLPRVGCTALSSVID